MNPYIRGMVDSITNKPVLIRQGFMTEGIKVGGTKDKPEIISWGNFAADLKALASVDVAAHIEAEQRQRSELVAAYGLGNSDVTKPFAFSQGTAVIPIHGSLMNRMPYSFSFATGYNFITKQLSAAMADPDVERIVYDVNSNGGVVTGCPEAAQAIFQANASNGGKPSVAVVDANCYSAAYYLSSAADKIILTPSGGAGSIGVVMMHADVSKALEDFGVKVTFVHAGDHKVDGNMFEPLSDDVKANFQASVDKTYDKFVADVSSFRPGLTEKAVRDTQARVYNADDALAAGLVDAVQSPTDALKSLASINTGDDDTMATAPENKPALTQADLDTAAATARSAERARMSGIMGHAEAAERQKLAGHLANNTDMTVEAAAAVLAASAKETPVAAAAPAKEPEQANHFKTAMDNSKHPNAGGGTEGGAAEGGAPVTASQRILAAQAKATGRKEQAAK